MSLANWLEKFLERFSNPTAMEFYSLFNRLAVYHKNGMLHNGIDSLVNKPSTNKKIARSLAGIQHDMANGSTLGEAFLEQALFPEFCGKIILVGEKNGRLSETLPMLAKRFKQESEIKRKISNALLPIAFIAASMLLSLFVMTTFVIPKFQVVYAENNMELPLLTSIIFGIADFVFGYWYLIFALGIGGYLFLIRFIKKNPEKIDKLLLKIPFYKSIYYFQVQHRFFSTMGLLRMAGTTTVNSLRYAADVVNNFVISKILLSAADQMEHEGKQLAAALEDSDTDYLLDEMGLAFMATGEDSSDMTKLMEESSEYYEGMIADEIEKFSIKIGPVFLMPTGFILIIILMAVYWPMVKQIQFASGQ